MKYFLACVAALVLVLLSSGCSYNKLYKNYNTFHDNDNECDYEAIPKSHQLK